MPSPAPIGELRTFTQGPIVMHPPRPGDIDDPASCISIAKNPNYRVPEVLPTHQVRELIEEMNATASEISNRLQTKLPELTATESEAILNELVPPAEQQKLTERQKRFWRSVADQASVYARGVSDFKEKYGITGDPVRDGQSFTAQLLREDTSSEGTVAVTCTATSIIITCEKQEEFTSINNALSHRSEHVNQSIGRHIERYNVETGERVSYVLIYKDQPLAKEHELGHHYFDLVYRGLVEAYWRDLPLFRGRQYSTMWHLMYAAKEPMSDGDKGASGLVGKLDLLALHYKNNVFSNSKELTRELFREKLRELSSVIANNKLRNELFAASTDSPAELSTHFVNVAYGSAYNYWPTYFSEDKMKTYALEYPDLHQDIVTAKEQYEEMVDQNLTPIRRVAGLFAHFDIKAPDRWRELTNIIKGTPVELWKEVAQDRFAAEIQFMDAFRDGYDSYVDNGEKVVLPYLREYAQTADATAH